MRWDCWEDWKHLCKKYTHLNELCTLFFKSSWWNSQLIFTTHSTLQTLEIIIILHEKTLFWSIFEIIFVYSIFFIYLHKSMLSFKFRMIGQDNCHVISKFAQTKKINSRIYAAPALHPAIKWRPRGHTRLWH